ncbi:hypothetical protein M758_8G105500 [Ceratodon purpureus]|nr:hypothetical protein M758_8G105500 [Ceratodon purpureus]
MNLSDDEEAPVAGKEPRKRKIGEVEPLHLSSLAPDKFGALRDQEAERPSVHRRVQTTADSSTGSFTPFEQHSIEGGGGGGGGGRQQHQGVRALEDQTCSTWGRYIEFDLENEGTSQPVVGGSQRLDDPSSHSSIPISCTLHERTSISSAGGGPTLQLQQFFAVEPPSEHNVDESTRVEPSEPSQNELQQAVEVHNESEQGFNAGSMPTALSRIYSIQDRTTRTAAAPPSTSADPRPTIRFNIEGDQPATILERAGSSELHSLDDLPRFAPMGDYTESSDDAWHSRQSTDQYPVRINYRFASARLEASLLERMEQRQRVQDEDHREERICGHVISPEDLVWGSVKHYCGMVLDRETSAVLGTAILFMPPDQANIPPERKAETSSRPASGSKSAWVTSVKVVEGRTEVLIKNSRGNVHVAQLMLTSTVLGLALFSLHVGQGTFALAFLSRVIGPASLPHRLFVDVDRSDRVYVVGYEEPWESEVGTISDVRVRPGRIIDAGRHAIVEIDFTSGQLGGSINSPVGFRGGLVVRADGLLAGVVTGDVLGNHPTNIDFSPAFNVYSLLEEL